MSQSPIDMLSIRESRRMFRIPVEIVGGPETLSDPGPCVSISGSARAKPENPLHVKDETVVKLLVESGYGVITDGGSGLMETSNKEATEAGGTSVGLHIQLPHEQECNKYVEIRNDCRYFFPCKLMFVEYVLTYVVMPGGMSTIGGLPEALILAQARCIRPPPIILYQNAFWDSFLDWVHSTTVSGGYIRVSEVGDLATVYDTPEQVVQQIRKWVVL